MKYILEDLLDDMTPMRTSTNPLSDSTDTSPDYTDASYYDMCVLIRYMQELSEEQIAEMCQEVEYVLLTTKHIDDFSTVVAFPNSKDDSLGTIFTKPENILECNSIGFAIKHSFANLRQLFRFIMNLKKFTGDDGQFITNLSRAMADRGIVLMEPLGDDWHHWDYSAHLTFRETDIEKFIAINYNQSGREFDKTEHSTFPYFTSAYRVGWKFMPEINVVRGMTKYYNKQFEHYAFNHLCHTFITGNLNNSIPRRVTVTAFDNFIARKGDAARINPDVINKMNATLYSEKFPFNYTARGTYVSKSPVKISLSPDSLKSNVRDEAWSEFHYQFIYNDDSHILRLLIWLGVSKVDVSVLVLQINHRIEHENEVQDFAQLLNILFNSIMKPEEVVALEKSLSAVPDSVNPPIVYK